VMLVVAEDGGGESRRFGYGFGGGH
jgi:hypothetical protein